MTYIMPSSCQIPNLAKVYEEFFPNKSDGFFVDVGAYDGYEWSNTWGLSEAGWQGLCIEPYPMYSEKCSISHGISNHKVVCIQCAVGNFNGVCNMFLDPTGPSHSIDEETIVRSPWGFKYTGDKLEVPCFTLDHILEYMNKVKTKIDVLSIDVEGAEVKVLEGFNLKKYSPTMIIIETHNGQYGKDFHYQEINNILIHAEYYELHADGLNSIYIHK